ncbi:MAG TPA: hypothetical protein PLZ93_05240 [Nocardioides sp.]|uniref:hypothetical protein n=1 Tax=uncultured Nocardioides sp. TaxID=198441 RepID=UPI000EBC8826|nr:hypothetical protein [uncultured Nocardioides sp.]HCB03184.1 hypothetical protein [Nocardioides sp.]HRI94993.1 hypothetical protein [Nocardioides sp.]HRK44755.1 hypothetical protein [Nocardioides sp.]
MTHSLTEPDVGMPPRPIYEWTAVQGHHVSNVEKGRANCTCGRRQPRHDLLARPRVGGTERTLSSAQVSELRAASRAWRDTHLAEAWPILIERGEGETLEGLAARIETALELARSRREELAVDLHVAEGEAFPVASEEELEAGTRAAVLKHQHQEVCRQLADSPWLRSELVDPGGDTIRWRTASLGDPRDEL